MCASEIGNSHEILDEVRLCAQAAGLEWGQVCELARFSKARGESLVEGLVARSGVDERALLKGLSKALNITFMENQADTIPPEVLETISATLAARYTVIPLEKANGDLRVACWDPFDWEGWDELAHIVRVPQERVLCPRGVIEQRHCRSPDVGA
ncbi:MAG: hypothetical protein NT031_19355 [Planctomycetota bacterium]|nr:hypothetical protein [Planctomycetota bacterium]